MVRCVSDVAHKNLSTVVAYLRYSNRAEGMRIKRAAMAQYFCVARSRVSWSRDQSGPEPTFMPGAGAALRLP